MKFKNYRLYAFLTLCLTITLLFISEYVDARAGGGGGFRSGGFRSGGFHSSGGHSGGGGGGGYAIYFLIRLLIAHPFIGIPVLIVVIVFFVLSSKQAHSGHVTRTIKRSYNQAPRISTAAGERALKQRDPNFSKERLAERVKAGFTKIQEAWSQQDMSQARHLISDGIFERFTTQLEINKNSLLHNKLSDIQIKSVMLVGIESDSSFDTAHFRITARMKDEMTHFETGKVLSKDMSEFTEYWSLLRRPGAKTLEKPGLFEGLCPNCGTPIEITDSTVCPGCQALINSGEYDWVLAEITQESEWNNRTNSSVLGIKSMLKKDPNFNVQHIEDRVSVMFFRHIASQFFADSTYLAKLATPTFLEENKQFYQVNEKGEHIFFQDAAIGAVDTLQVSLGEEFDKVRVKVKWSGHKEKAKIPTLLKPRYDKSHFYVQEYTLIRKSDAISSDKNILTSAHCPGCGAPETKSNLGVCEYCQTPLNDGSRDWVLESIKPYNRYDAIHSEKVKKSSLTLGAPALSSHDNETILAGVAAVMFADGVIDEKEKKLLQDMAKAKGVSTERLQMILNSVTSKELPPPHFDSAVATTEFLRSLAQMALIDGVVSKSEKELMKQLVQKTGYTSIDIDRIIKEERTKLYKAAKEFNKESKQL